MIIPSTANVSREQTEMVIDEVKNTTARKNHYSNISKHIPIEVGRYALDHGVKDILENFSKRYPKLTFKRTLANSWKALLKKSGDNQNYNEKVQPDDYLLLLLLLLISLI